MGKHHWAVITTWMKYITYVCSVQGTFRRARICPGSGRVTVCFDLRRRHYGHLDPWRRQPPKHICFALPAPLLFFQIYFAAVHPVATQHEHVTAISLGILSQVCRLQDTDVYQWIDQLQETLGEVQPQTREAIGQAKLAAEAGQLEQAVEILIAALEVLGNKASLPLQSLDRQRQRLYEADAFCDEQRKDIADLKQEVKELKKEANQTRQDRDRQRQSKQKTEEHILLGQAAYKFSALVEAYVFEGRDPESLQPPLLKQIHKRRKKNSLLPEQADRWDALVKRAPAGLSEENLVQSDAILRSQRFVSAHGSREQLQRTNIQNLQQWANTYIDSRALQSVRQYLEFLNQFSSQNKPLCPDIKIT